jgi:hypothetical protein
MGGAVFSQVDGDGYGGFDRPGLTGGLGIYSRLSAKTGLAFELSYSGKGSYDPSKPDEGKYTEYRINMHYIDIPILYTVDVSKWHFEGGLTGGILLGYNLSNEQGALPNDPYEFKTFELGMQLGGGYFVSDKWLAGLRFKRSILPTTESYFDIHWGFAGGSYNRLIAAHFNFFFTR